MKRRSLSHFFLFALYLLVACGQNADVAGSGFVQGGYAYLARDRQVHVVQITRPDKPRWVATFDVPGRIVKVEVDGRYAYVVHYPSVDSWIGSPPDGGVLIVDISRPKLPLPVGIYNTPDMAQDIAIRDQVAYVADWGGLRIVDVSDPTNPIELSTVSQGMNAVTIHDEHLYGTWGNCSFRTGYCAGGLWVADVSSPTQPVELDLFESDQKPGYSVAIREDHAYMAGNGLWQVDLSEKSNIRPGEILQLFEGRYQARVEISEHYAYLFTGKGIRVIDISDPDVMIEVAFLPMTAWVGDMALFNEYVYLASNEGLHIIDIHQPNEPSVIGYYSGVR